MVPCEQQLDMGESILRDGVILCEAAYSLKPTHRKGKGLKFPYLEQAVDGNVSEPGEVGIGPGKSSLFFLTARRPWNRIIRR
jgi:hypothetical protein